jgi:hypothetical protein
MTGMTTAGGVESADDMAAENNELLKHLPIIISVLSAVGLTGVLGAFFEQIFMRRASNLKGQTEILRACEKALALNLSLKRAGADEAELKNVKRILEEFDGFINTMANDKFSHRQDPVAQFQAKIANTPKVKLNRNAKLAGKYVKYSNRNLFVRLFTTPGVANIMSFIYFAIFVFFLLTLIMFLVVGLTIPFDPYLLAAEKGSMLLGFFIIAPLLFLLMQVFRWANVSAYRSHLSKRIENSETAEPELYYKPAH